MKCDHKWKGIYYRVKKKEHKYQDWVRAENIYLCDKCKEIKEL